MNTASSRDQKLKARFNYRQTYLKQYASDPWAIVCGLQTKK